MQSKNLSFELCVLMAHNVIVWRLMILQVTVVRDPSLYDSSLPREYYLLKQAGLLRRPAPPRHENVSALDTLVFWKAMIPEHFSIFVQ